MAEIKKHIFKTEPEREVAVCIAIQKIGLASVSDIILKIFDWGSKISEKQVFKCAENLRRRGLLSIDLSTKENGISIKKYAMKSIKLSIPEVAQIKDIIDDPSMNPLKEELDRSKKTMKKGLRTFDYYIANLTFKSKGNIQGFMPDSKGVLKHYRKNKRIIFYNYHFKNWFRDNLPLINRSSNAIGEIKFQEGFTEDKDTHIIEKYITNVESGFNGSKGTGGRGSRFIECLGEEVIVETTIAIPRELIPPNKLQDALEIFGNFGSAFGGGAKLSTGKLIIDKVEIVNENLWAE